MCLFWLCVLPVFGVLFNCFWFVWFWFCSLWCDALIYVIGLIVLFELIIYMICFATWYCSLFVVCWIAVYCLLVDLFVLACLGVYWSCVTCVCCWVSCFRIAGLLIWVRCFGYGGLCIVYFGCMDVRAVCFCFVSLWCCLIVWFG